MTVSDLKIFLIPKMCATAWHDVDKIAKCIIKRNVTIWKIYVFIGFCSGTIHSSSFSNWFVLAERSLAYIKRNEVEKVCGWPLALALLLSVLHVLPAEWWLKQFTAQLVASWTTAATTKWWLIRTVCRINLLLQPVVVLRVLCVVGYVCVWNCTFYLNERDRFPVMLLMMLNA